MVTEGATPQKILADFPDLDSADIRNASPPPRVAWITPSSSRLSRQVFEREEPLPDAPPSPAPQADYLGVPVEGPYEPEYYRY